jgi:hypothetical protein
MDAQRLSRSKDPVGTPPSGAVGWRRPLWKQKIEAGDLGPIGLSVSLTLL